MKTTATFSKPEEAHLFRTRLEAAGIPAYVQDEHFIQMNWLYSNAIGGVRVQIAEEDVEAAQEFLANDSPQQAPEAVDVVCPIAVRTTQHPTSCLGAFRFLASSCLISRCCLRAIVGGARPAIMSFVPVQHRPLTRRWSQPPAAVKSTFDFMKQFPMFATLAAASGGSALSR